MSDKLISKLGFNRVRIHQPLAPYVYMKVGGPADYFYESANSRELEEAYKVALEEKIPVTVIGNGANVLVSDTGIRGLVIKNKSTNLKFLAHGFLEVDSGLDNTELIRKTKDRSLLGAERLLKVPGTIGGATFMNAGDTGRKKFFDELLVSVDVLDREGNRRHLIKEECDFNYRSSRFQGSGEIILKVKLQLKEASKEKIEEAAKDILVRKMHQPAGASVGSTFKNPEADYAGRLVEACGLKGKKIGNAKISESHANFIINEGEATASDVKSLIDLMRASVKEKFDVDLEEEVRYLGDW